MKPLTEMSDDEFLENLVPPDFLMPALAELFNEALEPSCRELIAKRGHLVEIDDALTLGDEVVMRSMNYARGRLRLPMFPTLEDYRRYQHLRCPLGGHR